MANLWLYVKAIVYEGIKFKIGTLVCVVCLTAILAIGLAHASFGPDVKVNRNDDGTVNPFLKVDNNGNIYVAYKVMGGNFVIAKSTDGGDSFNPPVRINDTLLIGYFQGKESSVYGG